MKGTHQQNVMIFVSDEVDGASGFEILVTAYVSQCGGELAVSDEYQENVKSFKARFLFCNQRGKNGIFKTF